MDLTNRAHWSALFYHDRISQKASGLGGPLRNLHLILTVPDYNQVWTVDASVMDRALCTPTAFGAQLEGLYRQGFVHEVPVGTPYPTSPPLKGAVGFHGFQYEYVHQGGVWANAATFVDQLAFSWWFNTNGKGATDVPTTGSPVGTFSESALLGAQKFYDRTDIGGSVVGSAYHKPPFTTRGKLPTPLISSNSAQNSVNVYDAISTTISDQKSVVLMLDSWSVSPTHQIIDDVHLYNLNAYAPSNEALQEAYQDNDDAANSIGHTVLAVGSFEYNGCKWLVIFDNDPSTPQNVGLPFDHSCGGTRSVFDALIASAYVLAP